MYRGFRTTEVSGDFINNFYRNRSVNLSDHEIYTQGLSANEFVIYKQNDGTGSSSAIGRFHKDFGAVKEVPQYRDVFGLKAKNVEQQFALDLLFDDDIKLVTLVGPAGTGKTLLAIASGIKQVVEDGLYDKLIITKPVQPVGKDIGFLPGTKDEKMEPWIAPIKDNLDFLCGNRNSGKVQKSKKPKDPNQQPSKPWNYSDRWFEEGLIEIEAVTYMRGRSISNAFIIIDEAQNLSIHELKTIVTRVGEGTKLILTGDIDQIDNAHLDAYSNGLTCAVEKFKNYPIAGHISMVKGERSELATLASQIL
jgi:PhoH-like ATPase